MARAMISRDGEDVCGWSMATMDSVIISAVLGEKAPMNTLSGGCKENRHAYTPEQSC